MIPFVNKETLTNMYYKVKENKLTDLDLQVIYLFSSKKYDKSRADAYIKRIQNNEVSLDDFLTKMQSL